METAPARHIIMMGPPGSGKGTQSAVLSEKLGIVTVSTGELLRREAEAQTKEGMRLAKMLAKGNLATTRQILKIMGKELLKKDYARGYILDGFPRRLDQAKALDKMLKKRYFKQNKMEIDRVILLQVPDDYVIERTIGRFQCARCGLLYHEKFRPTRAFGVCDSCGGKEFIRRDDDTYETVVSRLQKFRLVTAPVIPYYEQKGLLVCVDGTGPIDAVSKKIRKIVGY